MKTQYSFIVLSIFSMLWMACQKKESNANFMVLETKPVIINGNTKNGVTFKANILLESPNTIIQYGFVYGFTSNPSIESDRMPSSVQMSGNSFTAKVDDIFMPDTTYHVRSFIKTNKFIQYGNEVQFFSNGSPPPELEEIIPSKAFFGDTVTIHGKYFDSRGKDVKVWFNDNQATKVWGNSNTLYAIVPSQIVSKKTNVSASLYGQKSSNSLLFEINSPDIHSISKNFGQYPDQIEILGNNFSSKHGILLLNGISPFNTTISQQKIKFEVPYYGNTQSVRIEFMQLGETVTVIEKFSYHEQTITGLSKDSIFLDDTLTVYANNIDFRKANLDLLLDNMRSRTVNKWQDSISFIPQPNNYEDYNKDHFNAQCIINYYSPNQKILFNTTIAQKNPKIISIHNGDVIYASNLLIRTRGINHYNGDLKFNIYNSNTLISNENWNIQYYFRSANEIRLELPRNISPGSCEILARTGNRMSSPFAFKILMPEVISISETQDLSRKDGSIDIHGNFLPNVNYYLYNITNNCILPIRTEYENSNKVIWRPSHFLGKGNYQLQIKMGSTNYTYPEIIAFNDYIESLTQFDFLPDIMLDIYSTYAFSINRKIYRAGYYTYDSNGIVIDIDSKSQKKLGAFYPGTLVSKYPTICNGQIYSIFNNGQVGVYHFDPDQNLWIKDPYEFYDEDIFLLWNNNEGDLFALATNGNIFRKQLNWNKIATIEIPTYSMPTFALQDQSNLYLWDYVYYKFYRLNTNSWLTEETLHAPVNYDTGGKIPQHIFWYKNELYFCYMRRGVYQTDMLKFNPLSKTFQSLDPHFIPERDYEYQFAPNTDGSVYMIKASTVYNFQPD
jgi:hypothetical protein